MMKLVHLLFVVLIGNLLILTTNAASKKSSSTKKVPKKVIAFGTTPVANTEWLSDSKNSIYTDVDTKVWNFQSTPVYLCSVASDSKGGIGGLKSTGIDLSSLNLNNFMQLANVSGIHQVRTPTNTGFRVRLHYTDDRNLTTSIAKLEKWRVRWVATETHTSIKGKTGLAAELSFLQLLLKEDDTVVKGLLAKDYQVNFAQAEKEAAEKAAKETIRKEKLKLKKEKLEKKKIEDAAKKAAKDAKKEEETTTTTKEASDDEPQEEEEINES